MAAAKPSTVLGRDLAKLARHRAAERELFGELAAYHAQLRAAAPPGGAPPVDAAAATELQVLYRRVLTSAAEEAQLAGQCLQRLKRIVREQIAEQRSAAAKRPTTEMQRPNLPAAQLAAGDIWTHTDYVLSVGQEVAALIDPNSEPKLWFLTSVQRFLAPRERYQVVDEDPGDEDNPNPVRKVYTVQASRVVPLYSLDVFPLSQRRKFRVGERIMALFPGTTTFYPCNVIAVPGTAAAASAAEYTLTFDDDDETERRIDAKYVIPFPKGYSEK
jgi:SAGA-associated factor 29